MNRTRFAPLAFALVALSSMAQAQPNAGSDSPAPVPAPTPPAPTVTTPPPVPVQAQGRATSSAAVSCELGETGGFSPERTRAWQAFLCDELATHGKSASPGAAGAQEVYRLDLMPFEKKIAVRLTRERPAGAPVASERTVIADADELVTALPRLLSALNRGESFEKTATMTNLTHQETRPLPKQSGDLLVGGSLLGMAFLGAKNSKLSPGIGLGIGYETPTIAAQADLRLSFTDNDTNKTTGEWVSLSVGGRYFLSDTNISPFFGAGVGLNWGSFKAPEGNNGNEYSLYTDTHKLSALGLYGEVGVEMLRQHRSRLVFSVRLDLPLGKVEGREQSRYVDATSSYVSYTPSSFYTAPLSLVASYSFQ